jgi:ribosome biogenesis GTPase A
MSILTFPPPGSSWGFTRSRAVLAPHSWPSHAPPRLLCKPCNLLQNTLTHRWRNKTKEQQRRHYICVLHKVVDEADVILLVLDARDPAGCHNRLVEEEVRRREAEGKCLVFVLNKISV